jgi:hypothetical protein
MVAEESDMSRFRVVRRRDNVVENDQAKEVNSMVRVRKVAGFVALVGLVLGFASVTDAAHSAQHRKSQARGEREITGRVGKEQMALQGSVVSVSPNVGFIVLRHGSGAGAEEIPVEIDSKTSLMRGGQRASIDTIRQGDRVRVEYSGSPGDVSKQVQVNPGAATRTGARKRT